MQFSVVVPVYNEAGNVRPLLAEINRAVRGQPARDVIYVDDASDDETAAELRQARSEFPALRVLQHPRRSGQSSALLTGVRAARAGWSPSTAMVRTIRQISPCCSSARSEKTVGWNT